MTDLATNMQKKTVGIVLFEAYHQKRDIASSRIRGRYLMNYWPEAEAFVQGKDYEVVVYQKVYWREHARAFKGKKILDICDPDWLDGIPVKEVAELMDAITVPTEALKTAVESFCDVPVYVVKDRFDLAELPEPKKDSGKKAERIVWFGYAHNVDVLEPAFHLIGDLGLILRLVTNRQLNSGDCVIENFTWTPEGSNRDIQGADFAILPRPHNRRNEYKSENKEVLAGLLGLPVAKDADDLRRFIDPGERQKAMEGKVEQLRKEYDVRQSVNEMKDIINGIQHKGL